MNEQKNQEWNLLVPLAPAIALVPLLAVMGVEPIDLGFAAIAAPLATVSYTHLRAHEP